MTSKIMDNWTPRQKMQATDAAFRLVERRTFLAGVAAVSYAKYGNKVLPDLHELGLRAWADLLEAESLRKCR